MIFPTDLLDIPGFRQAGKDFLQLREAEPRLAVEVLRQLGRGGVPAERLQGVEDQVFLVREVVPVLRRVEYHLVLIPSHASKHVASQAAERTRCRAATL